MGNLSPHFSREELACHHCGRLVIAPTLLAHLELLRARVGRPLVVVSGYRCKVHNRAVGGAIRSRHLTGEAVDLVPGYADVPTVERCGFKGIGIRRGKVVHVDIRPGPLVIFKD